VGAFMREKCRRLHLSSQGRHAKQMLTNQPCAVPQSIGTGLDVIVFVTMLAGAFAQGREMVRNF